MLANQTLNASPATLAEVLSNGKRYVVPVFQHDYAWDESEWSELWADLLDLKHAPGEHTNHYLGALVLQPTDQRAEMNIIDGQQRLVTLSILALAVIARIERLAADGQEPENNRERARLLRERFVSTKDSASLQHHSRLRLNQRDDGFYRTYLVQGATPSRYASLKGSEARLYKALLFFDKKIAAELGSQATGRELAAFLEDVVANRLRFIEIQVQDDETAFTVFETLNARGVALGTADLLKNFILSLASKGGGGDLEHARLWWDQILERVPMEQVASLLFHKLAGRVPELREKRVFAEVKRLVPTQMSVFEFLRELKDAAEIYAALDDPNDDLWSAYPDARRWVRVLEILRVEQYRPVALAAFSKLADRPDRIARLFHNLAVISLRALVARTNTGDLQRAYHHAAIRIESGEIKNPIAIARALSAITPSDDDFRAAFASLAYDPKGNRKRLVRFLIASLEQEAGGQWIDFDAGNATIEHVLPENPAGSWDGFSAEDRLRDVSRLGNLTPLEYTLNRSLGSCDFEQKREIYQTSRYVLTRSIQVSEWTPAAIRARQAELADLAVRAWRIDLTE